MNQEFLFNKMFNCNQAEPLLQEAEIPMASIAFDFAWNMREDEDDESLYHDAEGDTASVVSFDERVDSAVHDFRQVVQLFEKTNKAKNTFLKNFDEWAPIRKRSVQLLKEIARSIQTDKFNGDVSKVVGGVVAISGGVVLGLSFLTPLAPVTVPLAIGGGVAAGVGGGVVAGTSGTEFVLLRKKLVKAKALIKQEEENYAADMAHWFTHSEELKTALESLVGCTLLKEMSEDVRKFTDKVKNMKESTVGKIKEEFGEVLKLCMGKMKKNSSIKDVFGPEVAAVVMTLIFVICLMRVRHRAALDCAMMTQRLVLGVLSTVDIGVETGQLIGLAAKGAATAGKHTIARLGPFVALGIAIDMWIVVLCSKDIHTSARSKYAKNVEEIAEQLEQEFLYIEGVHNELKKYESMSLMDMTQRITVVVNHVPSDATVEDIKTAFKQYLPEGTCDYIELERLPTVGNNWLVKIPTKPNHELFRKFNITINGQRCRVTQ